MRVTRHGRCGVHRLASRRLVGRPPSARRMQRPRNIRKTCSLRSDARIASQPMPCGFSTCSVHKERGGKPGRAAGPRPRAVPQGLDTTPGQRFRVEQWAPYLAERGIEISFSPFAGAELMPLLGRSGHLGAKALGILSAGDWWRPFATRARISSTCFARVPSLAQPLPNASSPCAVSLRI